MVQYYRLDKVLAMNTDYQVEADKFLVITALGTDDTADVTPKIAGQELGVFTSTIAPLHTTSSNLLGPLCLGNLPYVVPKDKILRFEGTAAKKVRVLGKIGELAPGEAMPGDLTLRFDAQAKNYRTYVTGAYTAPGAVSWAAGAELSVYELVPKKTEIYTFNNYVGSTETIAAWTATEGEVGMRFYLDGKPLDHLTKDMGPLGVDWRSMDHPPRDAVNEVPFTLVDFPIKVEGDHVFKVQAVNNTTGTISIATGEKITIYAIVDYKFE